jgi:hypothetical protein
MSGKPEVPKCKWLACKFAFVIPVLGVVVVVAAESGCAVDSLSFASNAVGCPNKNRKTAELPCISNPHRMM